MEGIERNQKSLCIYCCPKTTISTLWWCVSRAEHLVSNNTFLYVSSWPKHFKNILKNVLKNIIIKNTKKTSTKVQQFFIKCTLAKTSIQNFLGKVVQETLIKYLRLQHLRMLAEFLESYSWISELSESKFSNQMNKKQQMILETLHLISQTCLQISLASIKYPSHPRNKTLAQVLLVARFSSNRVAIE